MLASSLAALGVVYGDIGTSPLYAMRECFHGAHAIKPEPAAILGVLSLIFWALVVVVSIKYLVFIVRADNRGEGGILALMALVLPEQGAHSRGGRYLVALGLFGAALLYGDGMITPAISVLSAVEGLNVATPFFEPYVVPITIAVLVLLFVAQYQGTARVGRVFGPLTLLWFLLLAALGIAGILREPHVLGAIDPRHAVRFFVRERTHGFLVLGSVFLVVTGGEALYADMGHFGRRPIRLSWFAIVLPALLLNYFGQGALLLRNPESAENPFYYLAPTWALYPIVALATVATIIASQAVISGSFSLTRQAVQLGYSPRMQIEHTSSQEIGQIYVSLVNWVLMAATIGLVMGFGSSSRLAAAYGIAVTTTMVITTLLFYLVARRRWGWNVWLARGVTLAFLIVDLSFFGANVIKIEHGGWFPLVVAGIVFTLMTTWKRGRQILAERLRVGELPVDVFLADIASRPPARVSGTSVFMTASPDGIPPALLHNLKHNKILHQFVVLLTIRTEEVPRVAPGERLQVRKLGNGFYRFVVRYGFMEDPDIPAVLREAGVAELDLDPMRTTYFLGRETLLPSSRPGMALWRERLFSLMSRNAQRATGFFKIPPNRVVEIGLQVEI